MAPIREATIGIPYAVDLTLLKKYVNIIKNLKQANERPVLVFIAGGKGERLFPKSNPECEKQFSMLDEEDTFISAAVKRFVNIGIQPARIVIITTSKNQAKRAVDQLAPYDVVEPNIIVIDPSFGYAGAMVKAAEFVDDNFGDVPVIMTPADAFIVEDEHFAEAVAEAVSAVVQDGKQVMIGALKNDVNTMCGCGHAYICGEDESLEETKAEGISNTLYKVRGFKEKPDPEMAKELLRKRNSVVNTGIVCCRPSDVLPLRDQAVGLSTEVFMQAFNNLWVTRTKILWFDCGTMQSYYDVSPKTFNHKNATYKNGGEVIRVNCRESLFISTEHVTLVAEKVKQTAVCVENIGGRLVVCAIKLSCSQDAGYLAKSYRAMLESDSPSEGVSHNGTRNTFTSVNMDGECWFGTVGVSDYALNIVKIKYPDGSDHYVVSVKNLVTA